MTQLTMFDWGSLEIVGYPDRIKTSQIDRYWLHTRQIVHSERSCRYERQAKECCLNTRIQRLDTIFPNLFLGKKSHIISIEIMKYGKTNLSFCNKLWTEQKKICHLIHSSKGKQRLWEAVCERWPHQLSKKAKVHNHICLMNT